MHLKFLQDNSRAPLPIPENLVITWPYTDLPPTVRPHTQGNQCLLSHFLASLAAQEKTNCTSMLWSTDSCQNRASLTSITWPHRGLMCRPIEVEYFFEVIRWQITSFKWSQAQVYFSNDSYQMCCVYVTIAPHY